MILALDFFFTLLVKILDNRKFSWAGKFTLPEWIPVGRKTLDLNSLIAQILGGPFNTVTSDSLSSTHDRGRIVGHKNGDYEWKQKNDYTKNIFETEQLFHTAQFIRHIFFSNFCNIFNILLWAKHD